MTAKRRDNKNRVLRTGEMQRKDGRYAFKYTDVHGSSHIVYSWKLEPTDTIPVGKRCLASLRELETQILKELRENVIPADDLTVLGLVEKYLSLKKDVKTGTKGNYRTAYHTLQKEPFANKRIDTVKKSDAKAWFVELTAKGKHYGSIKQLQAVLRPAFQMAVDDDMLNKNPFDFSLAKVITNDVGTRQALTKEEKEEYLEFIREDSRYYKYYEAVIVLFETGLRISEFCGLTLKDLDMKNRVINVDHQLLTGANRGRYIEATKTGSGTRKIPMTDIVYKCFQTIIRYRNPPKIEPIIDGYSGFLFYTKYGSPRVALNWDSIFLHISRDYNATHSIVIPNVTPHVCRHTYCSLMVKDGMNPKILQYLMGHSSIEMTLDTYTHLNFADAEEEVRRMENAGDKNGTPVFQKTV